MQTPSSYHTLVLLVESVQTTTEATGFGPDITLPSLTGGNGLPLALSTAGIPLIDDEPVTDLLWDLMEDEADEDTVDEIMAAVERVLPSFTSVSSLSFLDASVAKAALQIVRSLTCAQYPMSLGSKDKPSAADVEAYKMWQEKSKVFDVAFAIISMQMQYMRTAAGDNPDFYKSAAAVSYSPYY